MNFIDNFITKFHSTFIEKDRWMYLLDGLKTTLLITFFAVILGMGAARLPLLLRDRPPMPDWLRSTPLSRLLMVDARVDRAPEHIPGGPAELLLRDGRGWDLTASRAELRTM